MGTTGFQWGWVMDSDLYEKWLEEIDALPPTRQAEVQGLLAGCSSEAEVIAALERRVMAERRCAHCRQQGVVCRGRASGLRRFQCGKCGKTFNALSGTPLAHLHHKERWVDFAQSLDEREVVRKSAARCAIAASTAFRWRHRFFEAIKADATRAGGAVGADETYVLKSRKGSRAWKHAKQRQLAAQASRRKPRKRCGRPASVPVA